MSQRGEFSSVCAGTTCVCVCERICVCELVFVSARVYVCLGLYMSVVVTVRLLQEMTLQEMYVENNHHEDHLQLARVLVPSQCRCEAQRRVRDIGSEAQIAVSGLETPRTPPTLVPEADEGRGGIRGLTSPTDGVGEAGRIAATPGTAGRKEQEPRTQHLASNEDLRIPIYQDKTLLHQVFQEATESSAYKENVRQPQPPVASRKRRDTQQSLETAQLLVINYYLNQTWPNSCGVSSELYSNMNDILKELPDSFWQAGGTAAELDVALLAGALFAGASQCRVQNVTAALQTGHLASLLVASLRAATILKNHIMNTSRVRTVVIPWYFMHLSSSHSF